VLLILSEHSIASDWGEDEVKGGLKRNGRASPNRPCYSRSASTTP
jgi:hypothetical protein